MEERQHVHGTHANGERFMFMTRDEIDASSCSLVQVFLNICLTWPLLKQSDVDVNLIS